MLDKSAGYPLEMEEHAINPLAGGIARYGYQCGMIWGAAMAAGAQVYRKYGTRPETEIKAVTLAQQLIEVYRSCNKPRCINCAEIVEINFMGKNTMRQILNFFIKGKAAGCFLTVTRYARKADTAIDAGLGTNNINHQFLPISCTSLLARKMGAADMHNIMAAGLAGGIGLSGGGYGVLGAAFWLNEMKGHQQGDNINVANARAEEVVKTFLHASGNKFTCTEITGRRFNSIGDHADFIRQGGCAQIIESCTLKQLPAAVGANKKSVLVQN